MMVGIGVGISSNITMVVELCEGRCSEDERMDEEGFIYALTSYESVRSKQHRSSDRLICLTTSTSITVTGAK